MYKLKSRAEDFYVEEIPKIETFKKGSYSYFWLKKKGWNTSDAIKKMSEILKIKEKWFNVAGIKDKNAVTKQVVSVYGIKKEKLERLKIRDIEIEFIGYGDERLKLGQIYGNRFKVVVRSLDKEGRKIKFLENYYDDQRFGGRNKLFGEALVKREFRKVCYMLRVKWKENDYVNALRNLGKKRLRFFINSYQSYLWNLAVVVYLKKKYKKYFKVDYLEGEFIFSDEVVDNIKVPIIGFLSDFNDRDIEKIYDDILKKEEIKKENFLFREFPDLNSEGNERDLIVKTDVKTKYENDDMNRDKRKAILDFSLPAGSYGSLVVRKMFE